MKIRTTIALFCVIILGCSVENERIAENSTFVKIFNPAELNDLQTLFDFFNRSVCNTSPAAGLSNCYKSFSNTINHAMETGEAPFNISFEEQRQTYSKISDSTFAEIWGFGRTRYRDFPNDTFLSIGINTQGKYMIFLKEVGRENKLINEYVETIDALGNVPSYFQLNKLLKDDDINLKDVRIQLIIALNILTLNDEIERRDKINQ